MKMNCESLLTNLELQVNNHIHQAKELKNAALLALNYKENSEKWSVLECIEHLNLYSDFYIPELKKQLKNAHHPVVEFYKTGRLGAYFSNSMLPKAGMKKMKTFKDKNPINSKLTIAVLERFIAQQTEFLELIQASKKVNIGKVKTAVSISKIIKLKLGDTLTFLVNHDNRHLVQASKALASYS